MKKFRWILFLSCVVLLVFFKPLPVYAADDGYYIKNMQVDVKVNDKRQYMVTEKIDVYFDEERHGIIRKIPTSGSAEDWTVSDISVQGAPYEVDEGSTVQIKIGDEDEKIDGDKSYVVKYTLNHYDDEEDDYDYLYLSVLGTQWDTRVEKFSSTITYPSHMTLLDYKITSGEYGSSKNVLGAKCSTSCNTIKISSDRPIEEENGITINARFKDGDFTEVPKYKYDFIIENEEDNIEITKQQEYIINKSYSITANDDAVREGKIPVLNNYTDGSKLYDFKSSSDKVKLTDDGEYFTLPKDAGQYDFTVSYKIKPPLFSDLDFDLDNYTSNIKIENLKTSVKCPDGIGKYNVISNIKYEVSEENNIITVINKKPLKHGSGLKLSLNMNKDSFTRPMPVSAVTALIFAVVIFIISVILYLKYGRDENLQHVVEFYPPDGVSSAEAAYIINGHCKSGDITSLIFYWASHNHIKIVMDNKKKKSSSKFTLVKLSNLDSIHEKYEVKLFNEIFKKGDGQSVRSTKLENSIYDAINKAVINIRNIFTGEKSLYVHKSSSMQGMSFIISFITLIPLIMSRGVEAGYDLGDSLLCFVCSVAGIIIFYALILRFNKFYKLNKSSRTAWTIFIAAVSFIIYVILLCIFEFKIIPLAITFATVTLMLGSFAITAFISKKSRYNNEMTSRILGFKDFMMTAEKERLESLIEDDPEYFYNTLPYAQVLGVTNVWKNKFKDITMAPPSWYDSGYNTFDYFLLNSMIDNMNSVSDNMTSMPVSSSDSGGFSGGGFSGGGSGGGGGSSW